MHGVTEGRIVHYSGDAPDQLSHCQAAIVVKVWTKDTGMVNLTVFPDESNDKQGSTTWATSRLFADQIQAYKWHWATACPRDS